MEQREHPTHHQGYYATIVALYALSAALLLATIGMDWLGLFAERPGTRHTLDGMGILGFFAAALLAGVRVFTHGFARCPECQASLRSSHRDDWRTYYPCETCAVVWTCSCRRTSD